MIASPSDLHYFLESAKKLNLSRAAERIGISQPSLSVAIKRLEENIGTQLFIRQKNGLVLTQAGRHLEVHANQLLQLWENLRSEALASHIEVQGLIRFGCHSSVATYALPKFMPQILKRYPKLNIGLQHDLSRKILESIINLKTDIGIVVNPIKHPDLVLTKLYQDHVAFYCHKSINNFEKLLNRDDLILMCDPDLSQTKHLLSKVNKKIDYRLFTSSNLEVLAALAQEQNSIAILPHSIASAQNINSLKKITKLPSFKDEIYLAYRHENREIMAIKTLIEYIKKASWN